MARTALPTSFGSSSMDPTAWMSNWKGERFGGMNFSPTVLSTAQPEPQFAQPGGGMSVILPDKSVISDEMSNQLVDNSFDELALTGALGAKTLGNIPPLLKAKEQYEYAKELAQERQKDNKKSGGGFFSTLGRVAGGLLGGAVGGPAGAMAGSQIGGFLGGQVG